MLVPMLMHAFVEVDGICYTISADDAGVIYKHSKFAGATRYHYSGDIIIPPSITYNGKNYPVTFIDEGAFLSCTGLKSVVMPNTIKMIQKRAFNGCSSLTSLTLPDGLVTIGSQAFDDCTGLTSLIIPSSVNYIDDWAFRGCECIIHFMGVPTYITDDAFVGVRNDIIAPAGLKTKSGKKPRNYYAVEGNDLDSHITNTYCAGVEFYEPYLESYLNYKNIRFFNEDGTELDYTKTYDGYYMIKNLKAAKTQQVLIAYTDENGVEQRFWNTFTTKPAISAVWGSTQSSITIKDLTGHSDETYTPSVTGVRYEEKEYIGFPVVIDGLYPGQSVTIEPFADYDGIRVHQKQTVTSSCLTPYLQRGQRGNSASSLEIIGSYTKGDATITNEYITVNNKTYDGNEVLVTGLDPNKFYTVTYSFIANSQKFTTNVEFKTDALKFITSQPKVISEGDVIVAAELNVSDEETHVGFEWRRTDWTTDFASNTGNAYIYHGQMEGYIRNLNTNHLWKYRPYYLSNNGTYYYGDWVGLDPTNVSYFESTVHTYDKITIEGNTALVKGYALRGTDDIKVQGFKYWKHVSDNKAKVDRRFAVSVPSDAKTVEAKGQVMVATLADLAYDTEYAYVAYVTTTAGETFYGEEMTFATKADPTGIDDLYSETTSQSSATICGYYDLNGHRVQSPQHGIYIIRFSDGTSRKMVKK